jgi:membrane associated rhomboid family serine protease
MSERLELCTTLLILATAVVSYLGFQNRRLEGKCIFNPERILAGKEYHRLVTAAFLHAGWEHLLLNLITLQLFGSLVERELGHGDFLLIYFGSVIGGNLLSLYVHRRHQYLAYGASGGVCGIVFAYVLLDPHGGIAPFFLPIFVPGWLYALGFMLGSFYGLRRNAGNIGHDAHLGGAVCGLLVAAALRPELVGANPLMFLLVLGVSVALLVCLWLRPLYLPAGPWLQRRARKASPRPHRRETLEVDAILDKISRDGLESLSAEERAVLSQVSAKYRRREESKKPDSDLAI